MARTTTLQIGTGMALIGLVASLGMSIGAAGAEVPAPVAEEQAVVRPADTPTDPVVLDTVPPAAEAGIVGGTAIDHVMVEAAMGVMAEAGLELPPLLVTIHETREGCGGSNGLYRSDGTHRTVDVCHVSEYVILHELAHAWEDLNMTDGTRDAYVAEAGLDSWSDQDTKWVDRGVERAANTIAKVLMSDGDACTELGGAYETLTGRACGAST